jgi:hypothetical protein
MSEMGNAKRVSMTVTKLHYELESRATEDGDWTLVASCRKKHDIDACLDALKAIYPPEYEWRRSEVQTKVEHKYIDRASVAVMIEERKE